MFGCIIQGELGVGVGWGEGEEGKKAFRYTNLYAAVKMRVGHKYDCKIDNCVAFSCRSEISEHYLSSLSLSLQWLGESQEKCFPL